jgi:adenosylcobinamide-GDP ribazoletransferase
MIKMIKALLMSVGMFSVLPVPKQHWDERCVSWVIPFFPVVGGLIGCLWYVIALFATEFPLPLQSVVVLLVPFFLSGFLHLDGYIDTADAFFSRQNLEEKKRILKDSHIGAFGVVAVICLLLIQFCVIQTIIIEKKTVLAFVFIPIISRCVTGIALLNMKPMSETGYAVMFRENTKPTHTLFLLVFFIVTSIFAVLLGNIEVWFGLITVIVSALSVLVYLNRQFQGLSGDLCGCVISVSEMCGLLCVAIL